MGQKFVFEIDQPYHILSRAVEKRKIFEGDESCYRFAFQMYAANRGSPSSNLQRRDVINAAKALLRGERISSKFIKREHPPLVHVLSFALTVDHLHFALIPLTQDGIQKYMQKLNGGFAKYYNLKYNRTGALFESRYKRILIKDDYQLSAVMRYINIINPLDVFQPGWRQQGIKDWERALIFLNNYQFSSFPDLFGERNSKITAPGEVLEKYFPGIKKESRESYREFVIAYLKDNLTFLQPTFLE